MSEPDFFYLNIDNRWPGFKRTGLEIAADGALQLRALPRLVGRPPENLSDLPMPEAPAGVVRTDDGAFYFTDPERHRLWRIDPCDPTEMPQPAPCLGGEGSQAGQFKYPRGLLSLPGRGLVVADSGNHRLQIVDPPSGQVREIWDGFDEDGNPVFNRPWSLAADSDGNVYVVAAGDGSVKKIDRLGRPDPAFSDRVEQDSTRTDPVAVAIAEIDGQERLLVLDRALKAILVYSLEGRWQKTFSVDVLQAPLAIAVSGGVIYIGDNGSNWQTVLQFDLPALGDEGLNLAGTAVGYRGPVTALYVDDAEAKSPAWCAVQAQEDAEKPGYLLLLPGAGLAPLVLQERAGYGACGFAVAGPFDFRRQPVAWHRLQAVIDALPPHAHARFFFFLGEPPPGASPESLAAWLATLPPAFDPCHELEETLAAWCAFPRDATDGFFDSFAAERCRKPPSSSNGRRPATATYLWLGVMLSGDGTATPRLHQIRLQFDHKSYLPHLPAIYSEDDASRQFLLPFLSLFESFFEEHEAVTGDLPALFDPAAAPSGFLEWLAGWLAQDIEEAWSDERKRHMIAEAFAAYARRGTPAGLRRRLQQFAGVQAHILEPIQHTDLWSLGETSTLGFDTRLVSAHPQGAVLGSTATLDQSHLITNDQFGEPLFEEVAHQFVVQIYRGQVNSPEREAEVRQVIERDKPAHTDYHLCFVEPRMRVGFQARVGIDTVVAGPPEVLRLNEALGRRRSLGGPPMASIGQASQIGVSTRVY